jgi:hypothetical protein
MSTESNPSVRRRHVGSELRRYRQAARKTLKAAGAEIEIQQPAMSKIEAGHVGIRMSNIVKLMSFYGASDEDTQSLLDLANAADRADWWEEPYGDAAAQWFGRYVGLESGAVRLKALESRLVFGAFQTRDYATAVLSRPPGTSAEELSLMVDLRMERRERLLGDPTKSIHVVLDEATLHREIGDPEIRREQCRDLIGISELGHVKLQVIPLGRRHSAVGTSFSVLRDRSASPVVYIEYGNGALYLEKRRDIDHYDVLHEQASDVAHDAENTRRLLATVMGTV